jgi:hypothetical protein
MSWVITPRQVDAGDADAIRYLAAVEAADAQTLEPAVRLAVDAFIVGCKADGIWTAIKASCILAGARTLTGALVPLVGTVPPTNVNFVSGDYNRKTGLVGNKSNKYIVCNRSNNADPQNSRHHALYGNFSVADGSYDGIMGTDYSGTGWTSIYIDRRPATDVCQFISSGLGGQTLYSQQGLFGMSRSSSAQVLARNGGISATISSTSGAPSSGPLRVFATGTSAPDLTNGRIAFYSIGESLDLALLDARATTLVNAFAAAIP